MLHIVNDNRLGSHVIYERKTKPPLHLDHPAKSTIGFKIQVDHINHNRTDNRIENLRWVSRSENAKNKTISKGHQYVFIDDLPNTAEPLDAYNGHEFDGLWIDYENKKLYVFNGIRYRELIACRSHDRIFYSVYDIEGTQRQLGHKVLFG